MWFDFFSSRSRQSKSPPPHCYVACIAKVAHLTQSDAYVSPRTRCDVLGGLCSKRAPRARLSARPPRQCSPVWCSLASPRFGVRTDFLFPKSKGSSTARAQSVVGYGSPNALFHFSSSFPRRLANARDDGTARHRWREMGVI